LAAVLGAERFVKEIKTTANLQHPHILPLFDSGEADSFLYYVMPFIDGETLRDKLNRETQLGIEEAVSITTAIADALNYAHRQNVIHRDIKPENILLHDGRPMVADFGIALAVSAAAGGRMTETGLSLGTPHYMSPEQATAEKDLTNRSDIYSLGCVLYEMLTGEPPHTGASAQAIIMKIVTDDARPITELRKSVPAHVAAATAKSLEKLAADRFATAQAFGEALQNTAFVGRTTSTVAAGASAGSWNRLSQTLAGIAIGLLIVVGALVLREGPEAMVVVSRFTVELMGERGGDGATFNGPGIAIAEDGSRFAYLGSAGAQSQILVRERNRLDAEPVRSTNDVRCCLAFSPDGQSLAYITTPIELKVVSLRGGVSTIVADSGLQDPSLYGGGVDWGPDGHLYLSMVDGIWRIPPDGGERERVTRIGPGERTHAWADVLPNGKGALVTIVPRESSDQSAYAIGIVDFATSEITVLFQGVYARYAPSGHIVFVQDDGTMLAALFDQDRLEVTDTPVALIDDVDVVGLGAARMALSQTGTLVYRRGTTVLNRLVWVDRNGAVERGVAPELEGALGSPRLSPNAERLAVNRATAEGGHVWTKSLRSGDAVRHTFEGQLNWRINWSPAGDALYFISDRVDNGSVFVKPVDGTGIPVRMPLPESRPIFEVIPVDDRTMVIRTDNQAPGNGDILLVQMGADTTVTPLVATQASELTPAVSRDHRWLAYMSDESGTNEIFVRPFPNVDASVFRVSTNGGTEPVWAHSGRELFYRNGDGDLVAADVVTAPTFRVTRQQVLFSAIGYNSNDFDSQYDVSLDDQRFLMIIRDEPDVASAIVVVTNWFEELKEQLGN
ncbi:MAG: protein kinase, partial [Gemmatimonadetes bacterium]|nr:protein kinase [Gemmatimonadota bacterium]